MLDDSNDTSPAKAGVIERIELRNFMCHDFFELNLGPQINFIIGRNGAGKSAILTGISVGLGARATDTNRGSSVKDLIKNDKQVSRTLIILTNEGSLAYSPEIYGNRIKIKRKFDRDGKNSYSIEKFDGTTISNKKSTIDSILNHFDIIVDNPMAFLSQDKAREFLHSTLDSQKFDYFMTGSNITDIKNNVENSKQHINSINEKHLQALLHYKVAEKLFSKTKLEREKLKNIAFVSGKRAEAASKVSWCKVIDHEYNIKKYQYKAKKIQSEIDRLLNKIIEIEESTSTSSIEISKLQGLKDKTEKEFDIVRKEEEILRDRRNIILENIEQNKQEIVTTESTIKDLKKSIEKYNSAIRLEQKNIDEINGGSKDALNLKLAENEAEIKSSNAKIDQAREDVKELTDKLDMERKKVDIEVRELERKIYDLRRKTNDFKASQRDKYRPWGPNMNNLIDAIKRTKNWHHEPIGPMGIYINVKEDQLQWKDVINTILSKSLDSFLCFDEHDKRKLDGLMRSLKCFKNIIVRKQDRFDYTQGKPSSHMLTFADIITASHEQVSYTLVDVNKIEKNVIADNDSQAERFARERNVGSVFVRFDAQGRSANSAKRITLQGGTSKFDPVYYDTSVYKLAAGGNSESDLSNINHELETEARFLQDKKREFEDYRRGLTNLIQRLNSTIKSLQAKVSSLEHENFDIVEKLSGNRDFAKIEALKQDIEDAERQILTNQGVKQGILDEIKVSIQSKEQIDIELTNQKREVKVKLKLAREARQQLIEFETDLEAGKNEINSFIKDKEQAKSSLEANQLRIQQYISLTEQATIAAEGFCQRGEITLSENDTIDSLSKEYLELDREVKEAELSSGRTMAEVNAEYDAAEKTLEDALETVKKLEKTCKRLSNSSASRKKHFESIKKNIVRTATQVYDSALQFRQFKGSMDIDFEKGVLGLLVLTAKNAQTRAVGSLSGGEKSYIQISMLLAIWKIMHTTIRGLDEFDVFMDSVNRSLCIKLLLMMLKGDPKSQNIFITPQDIASVADVTQENIKIHTMADPRSDL